MQLSSIPSRSSSCKKKLTMFVLGHFVCDWHSPRSQHSTCAIFNHLIIWTLNSSELFYVFSLILIGFIPRNWCSCWFEWDGLQERFTMSIKPVSLNLKTSKKYQQTKNATQQHLLRICHLQTMATPFKNKHKSLKHSIVLRSVSQLLSALQKLFFFLSFYNWRQLISIPYKMNTKR